MTVRKIGPVLATFVVANNMIGSGFFLLPATLATAGAVTVFSWIVGTALALVLGGAFARLAREYPDLQSADDYVRPSLGRDASFLATSLYWASSWIGNNAIAVAAFGYLVMLLPLDGSNPMVQVGGQIALIWLMFAVNLMGPKPVATALEAYPSLLWLKTLVEIAAIAGLSSVILVMLMAQPRIFYSMSRDGLLPKIFGKVHPKYHTPYIGTIIVGVIAATLAGFLPIGLLGEMVSMGTLLAFATVCAGVLILRYTKPGLHRPFRVPLAIIVCPLGVLSCLYLFAQPFMEYWFLFLGWTAIGMLIYFGYGYRHSKLRQRR